MWPWRRGRATPSKLAAGTGWRQSEPACMARVADRQFELLAIPTVSLAAARAVDPTVEVVASRYGRAPSTVRGWCEAGRFPGAYKLHDREWSIPTAAVEAFDAAQRERPDGRSDRCVRSLGDWRQASRRQA
jgi:hypothetical protein